MKIECAKSTKYLGVRGCGEAAWLFCPDSKPEQQGMYHLHVIIHMFGFCSYALFALTSPLFTRFLNSKFYIGVGGIHPTWQSKDTSEAIVYTWKSINP